MKNRRKKFYLKDGGQARLLRGFAILALILIITASGLFYFLANENLENATYKAHFSALRSTMQMLLPYLFIVNIIGLLVVVFLAIFYTHRIAGPAYRLANDIKKLGDGDLTVKTNLRRLDHLKNLAEQLNSASQNLNENIKSLKSQADNLAKSAEGNEKLLSQILSIRKSLDKFNT